MRLQTNAIKWNDQKRDKAKYNGQIAAWQIQPLQQPFSSRQVQQSTVVFACRLHLTTSSITTITHKTPATAYNSMCIFLAISSYQNQIHCMMAVQRCSQLCIPVSLDIRILRSLHSQFFFSGCWLNTLYTDNIESKNGRRHAQRQYWNTLNIKCKPSPGWSPYFVIDHRLDCSFPCSGAIF